MIGMNAANGRRLTGIDHIRQSVRDILTTPIGSRVMRRDYGSLIPELIDQPMNDVTLLQIYAAAVMAVIKWEPRILISSIQMPISAAQPGTADVFLSGITQEGRMFDFTVAIR